MGASETVRRLERPAEWGAGLTRIDTPQARLHLPAGTVTFLLSDIERSTRLWEAAPEAMARAVPLHYAILSEAIARRGGVRPVEQGEGDSLVGAFSRASDAVAAAHDAQRELLAHVWPDGAELRVRIALHTAEAQLRDEGNYFGVALSRCARLRAIAHGGHTLLSRATSDLVLDALPEGASLVDLGMHRLRDLGRPEHVYGLVHPDLPAVAGELCSLDALPNNLPDQLTSFVGRTRELDEAWRALHATRLLTLTGAGGCGKTRLALQVAADSLDAFPDGAWLIELAPLADEQLVSAALAAALGVRPAPGVSALQAVCSHLAERRALVILDNCEHLLATCAVTAEAILHAAPAVTVLATSRAPLRVAGETDWRVPSLSLPSPTREAEPVDALAQSDAVRLFIERAAKVRPNFAVTNANAPAVAQICHALDGIPLAIELAAARIRVLSAEQIADGLCDRFHLLTGGARTALPRQQTLRASVEWSHALLSGDEQVLLRRLGVFAGGFAFDAVEDIGAGEGIDRYAVLDLLGSLVDKSLVVAEEHGPAVRYRLLETVRQYALERLADSGEADAVRDRHRDAYLALAERAAPDLETARQRDWLNTLHAEAANFAAAIERATTTDPERALRLCTALTHLWRAHARYAEADAAFGRALDAADAMPSVWRARASWGRAFLAIYAGDLAAGEVHARVALELAETVGDDATIARALTAIGIRELYAAPATARSGLERAIEHARRAGDEWALVEATGQLASSYLFQGQHAPALRITAEIAELTERIGHPQQVGLRWLTVGLPAFVDGRFEEARTASERARATSDATGEPGLATIADALLGQLDVVTGEPERALARMLPRLERCIATGAGLAATPAIAAIGFAELSLGRFDAATQRLEQAIAGSAYNVFIGSWASFLLAECRRLSGDPSAAASAERGRADCAVYGNKPQAACAGHTLGRLAAARGAWTEAEQYAHELLAVCIETRQTLWLSLGFDALAEAAAGLGSPTEAARLLGIADAVRAQQGTVRFMPEHEHWAALEAALREQLGDEGYDAAHTEGLVLARDEAIAWTRRARGERKRPPGGWESLTPTELRVVALAAEGLTNPEIGERMFISRGTAKTHLAHVYAKLDVKNRSQLAALATQHDNHRSSVI